MCNRILQTHDVITNVCYQFTRRQSTTHDTYAAACGGHQAAPAGGGGGRSPVVDELVVYGVARSSLHDVTLSLLVSERDGRDLGRRGDRPERRRAHSPRSASRSLITDVLNLTSIYIASACSTYWNDLILSTQSICTKGYENKCKQNAFSCIVMPMTSLLQK